MAEALYRKYRPQTFEDVVGQEHIERTLRNAIQSDKVSHAYLFTGPRGTGKTTTARLLAKALLCEGGPTPDPDGTCEDCMLIAAGEHPDVYELDAASRTGVENVREEIIGRVNYAPTRGRYKVYIIDEVHMLSVAAFNALLKTLEEPPEHVVFILCTTDPQKVPETIQSRCQRFDFRRIASEELISRLGAICEMEGVDYEGDALDLIAHRAQGGMRDALTSLEQLITFSNGSVSAVEAERLLGALDSSELADIVKAIGVRDAAACFRWTSEYVETGADLAQITKDLAEHIRDMYVMSLAGADVAIEVSEAGRRELQAELAWFGSDRLARLLAVLGDLIAELKTSTNQRLSFEIALTRMIRPESDITLSSLAERIEALERSGVSIASTAGVAMGAPMGAASQVSGTVVSACGSGADDVSCGNSAASASSMQSTSASAEGSSVSGASGASGVSGDTKAPIDASEGVKDVQHCDAQGGQIATLSKSSQDTQAQAGANTTAVSHASPNAGASLSGQDVVQVWNSIVANLKKQSEAYGVLFMNTGISAQDDGKKLLIEFSPSNTFAFNAARKPEVRDALEKALASVGLSGLAYEVAQSDRAVAAVSSMTSEPQAQNANSAMPVSTGSTSAGATANVGMQAISGGQAASSMQAARRSAAPRAISDGVQDDYDDGSYPPDDYLPSEAYEDAPPFAGGQFSSAASSDSAEVSTASPQGVAHHGSDVHINAGEAAAGAHESRSDAGEPTMSEITDNLASMFGEGVVFEEVK